MSFVKRGDGEKILQVVKESEAVAQAEDKVEEVLKDKEEKNPQKNQQAN